VVHLDVPCGLLCGVLWALGALPPRDFAWSTMVNRPSIRLINSIEMDLSSASYASNNPSMMVTSPTSIPPLILHPVFVKINV
jgi:hypothetical protein